MERSMNIREKIDNRMDTLQEMMESNVHLKDPTKVIDVINRISPFWTIMNEEDRDYVQCAQHAVEDQAEWRV